MASTKIDFDFHRLRHTIMKSEEVYNKKVQEYEKKVEELFKKKQYKEALELSVNILQQLDQEKVEDEYIINRVKRQIIKINNNSAVNYLQKQENDMAKYFLQISEKFLHKDLETYLATKNNFCCYFSNIGHYRNSKAIMSELLKINSLKKIEDLMKFKGKVIHNYCDIANDYSNLCSFSNKLKNYNDALLEGMQSVALNQLTLLNENLYNRKFQKLNKNKSLDLIKKSLYSRMMLAYFNIGVQQEYLKRSNDCEVSYNRSRALANLIGDKAILKRLSKSANNSKNMNTNNNSNSISVNNSTMNKNIPQSFSNINSTSMPNFTLYAPEVNDINFKESLVQHEITVIKCENISMQDKVNKLLQFNKLKKNPYFSSSSQNYKKSGELDMISTKIK